jgi:autotransporter-associated beta strand protein
MGVVLGNATDNRICVDGSGNIIVSNIVSGSGKALTLAGTGSGALTLSGANTYSGNTTLRAGRLKLGSSGSIGNSPHIAVCAGATFDVSAVSGGFALGTGQTLKGQGTVIGQVVVEGTLAPGASLGTLTNIGNLVWAGGGTNEVEIGTATGTPGTDWDFLIVTDTLTIDVTNNAPDTDKFTLRLVGTPGGITNFVNTVSYLWPVATASNGVAGFNAGKFNLDTNGLTNDVAGGAFSVVLLDQTLAVRFTPAVPPCAHRTTNWFHLDPQATKTNLVMTFSNASFLTSVQALTMSNCTIAGIAYTNDVLDADPITGINLTHRTPLPPNTTVLVLTAQKADDAAPAAANALVIDTCGRGKSFDPVITTLTVTSGQRVQQRCEGILAAEHFLQVVNGTPGLKWLEVVLNGHVFRLTSLTDGQHLAADLRQAMHEGDKNALVLTGGGDAGSSALVLLTDTPAGALVNLPETVELTLTHTAAGRQLSWAAALTGWQLQASATADGRWADVTTPPVTAGERLTLAVAATDSAQFYRLLSPGGACRRQLHQLGAHHGANGLLRDRGAVAGCTRPRGELLRADRKLRRRLRGLRRQAHGHSGRPAADRHQRQRYPGPHAQDRPLRTARREGLHQPLNGHPDLQQLRTPAVRGAWPRPQCGAPHDGEPRAVRQLHHRRPRARADPA